MQRFFKLICFAILDTLFVPYFSNCQVKATLTVYPKKEDQNNFEGVGFHCFHHAFNIDDKMWNEVVYKRWREMSPSFVWLNHSYLRDGERMDILSRHLKEYEKTGSQVYITTWNPKVCETSLQIETYAVETQDSMKKSRIW